MKATLLTSLFLALSYFTIGQVNFHEMKLGSKYSEQALTEAIEKANWCGYYHELENYVLLFDDGAVVKLKNKLQLSSDSNGEPIEENCFQNISGKSENIHFINSSGWIVVPKEKVVPKSKKN
ncbi:MAG: hypothetical protein DBW72_07260 [Flavobacteriales bacterium]|nr:MAG: hypothetical protein DBW72_07260 [Flavobacteriales bacterium]